VRGTRADTAGAGAGLQIRVDWSGGSGVADERQGFGGIRPNSIYAGAVNTLFGRYDI